MAVIPQDPTPRLTAQDAKIKSRQRAEDKIITKVVIDMKAQSKELFERIQRRIFRLDIDRFGNIKQTNKNLADIEQINQLLSQGADIITSRAIKDFKDQTGSLSNFYFSEIMASNSSLNDDQVAKIIGSNQLEAVRNVNLDNMRTVSASFTQEIRRQLNQSLFENIGAEEISDRLQKALIGTKDKKGNPMTQHADTIAKTAYNAYANALAMEGVNANDIVAYYYSGAQDSRNRSFCSIRVNKVHEKRALESAIAQQSGGTLHNAGGWNCRHQLLAITKFEEEAKPFLSEAERIDIFGE